MQPKRLWIGAGLGLAAILLLAACTWVTQTSDNDWAVVEPGGDTLCSDGTPYRFLVRLANPAKLHFHLQGGGGCWSRETCDPQMQPTYTMNTEDLRVPNDGVFDFSNKENPLYDYSVVYASYCTGDIHLGATDRVYDPAAAGQDPLTIHHRGRANVEAALQWTYTQLSAPKEIFVSGSSAGALPSPYFASILANHYPQADIAHLGDGAGGYRFDEPDLRARDIWDTFSFLDETPGFERVDPNKFTYEALYVAAAKAHPEILFARYDTAEDEAQRRFIAMRVGKDVSMLPLLKANNDDIKSAAPNFRSYVAGGTLHTILRRPEFYGVTSDGVPLVFWVKALQERESVADVHCRECDATKLIGR